MNTDGKSVLITRYFRAIKPPEELIEDGETSVQSTVISHEPLNSIFSTFKYA